MTAQRYEIEARLGDDHGLTDEQLAELHATADRLAERYPGPDDAAELEAALTTAYRLLVEDQEAIVFDLAGELLNARIAERRALAALREAARLMVGSGLTESGFARMAGVDRMTVRRAWLGK